MSIEAFAKRLITVRTAYQAEAERVVSTHPDWHAARDARSTILPTISNVLLEAAMSMVMAECYVRRPEWWKEHFGSDVPPETCLKQAQAHVDHAKFAFLLIAFSCIDSNIRQVTRVVHPGDFKNATQSIAPIYRKLLQGLGLEQFVEPMNLLRELRNLSHNMGVYCNSKSYQHIPYKGKTYSFVDGKKVTFATWDLVTDLVEDVLDMYKQLIWHPTVAEIEFVQGSPNPS